MKAKLGLALLASCSIWGTGYAAVDDAAAKVKWGYEGAISSSHWASLSTKFDLCSSGKRQSPIDIKTEKMPMSKAVFKLSYQPTMLSEIDDGTTSLQIGNHDLVVSKEHGVQLNVPAKQQSNQILTFDKKVYHLLQFHFHTPAETQLNDQSAAGEIHFVHQGKNGEVAVVAVFIQEGKSNPVLDTIVNHIPKMPGQEIAINEVIDFSKLVPAKKDAYRFQGSLTTPPCTEGLAWLVIADPITASAEQLAKLRQAAEGGNARPTQPLNKRPITFIPEMVK